MVTREKIDRFYIDVKALGLKFPVAAIAKVTGANKGNVSQILRKKLEPSESFLNKFYEGFKIVSQETKVEEPENHYHFKETDSNKLLDTIAILVKQNDKLAETNRILAEKISTIPVGVQQETQTGVESMLKGLREFVLKLSVGARYKSIEEAESAFYKSVGDFVPKRKVKGIQNG